MTRPSIRKFVANLSYYFIVAESLSTLSCRNCRAPLDIHQPNPDQPDQFLGTCPGCGRWCRVEWVNGEDHVTVMQIPDVVEIRAASPVPDAQG